ncbi:MAG: hypothetical protein K9G62_04300 [Alphaproteobacteria bacterium]|nr:hypothetical protein [Alphaproteobacteria bacterium]
MTEEHQKNNNPIGANTQPADIRFVEPALDFKKMTILPKAVEKGFAGKRLSEQTLNFNFKIG